VRGAAKERRHARHETFALLVLERILTLETTSWLVDADPEIMQGLLSAVAGIDDGAVLGSLVAEADRASVERDLRENRIDSSPSRPSARWPCPTWSRASWPSASARAW
jgi:hypothetical protein